MIVQVVIKSKDDRNVIEMDVTEEEFVFLTKLKKLSQHDTKPSLGIILLKKPGVSG